ncbi:uncharacterized protein LOC112598544 [Melanaphis sacchari]|uniref:uncharacterized protein LOC112598544 n=1 Tax=Melanaphis sacchari TaxID=742174 RepID=UPI000DC13B4E|nr:uncharacterized protein LOC112598544 [Melanaphis sacchari]
MAIQINPFNNSLNLKILLINNINEAINWLLNLTNFGLARNDGTPVNRLVVTRSWFDIYATTGLGKTESASKMDCVIQITQLMKENFGINSCLDSHKLQTNTKCFDDLPSAIYIAENSSMFPKEQTEKLGILGYFLDTGDTKLPLEMLNDISNIMITRPRETSTTKDGMHVYRHYINFYCSTGVGLTLENAKMRSAEQMIYTLKKICGFVLEFKLPVVGNPGNDRNDHHMWLCLPIDDQYKIKLIRYFLETSSEVPHAVQLNKIASMMKVVVKYSDSGNNKPGVACEFGPYITVGVGSTKMISVYKSRSAMLNHLKLVCGYVQYPRTFTPLDCLESTVGENHGTDYGYDRREIPIPNFLTEHPSNEVTPAEPLELWNHVDTTSTPLSNTQESIEIVMQDGVIVRGTFKPIIERVYNSNMPTRHLRRNVRCLARIPMAEESSENPNQEDTN